MTQKALVIGAGGFVGRNFIELVAEKYDIIGLSHCQLDLLDAEGVRNFFECSLNVDVVIHCAVVGGSRLTSYDAGSADVVEQNLRMFFNVARCIKPHQRLIYLGSGAEYDRTHYQSKMAEAYFDSHVPADAYGFAKYTIAKYIAHHENMLNLRIFGLYGPHEDYRYKFISNAVIKGLLGIPVTLAQNAVFDYLYVNDFVDLVERLIQVEWPYRHMNITPTQSIDLLSLAHLANEATGNAAGIKVLNPGWNVEYTGDNSKLLEVVGPFSFTSHREGIRNLTTYYRSIWDSLDLDTVRADPYIDKCIVRR